MTNESGWSDGETGHARRVPDKATSAPPGSEEKVEVMRRRWEWGEHLHHPDDRVLRDYGSNEDEVAAEGWWLLMIKTGCRSRLRRSSLVRCAS